MLLWGCPRRQLLPLQLTSKPLTSLLSSSARVPFPVLAKRSTFHTNSARPAPTLRIQAHLNHKLTPQEMLNWEKVPCNEGRLREQAPELLSEVWKGLAMGLDKHKIGDEIQVTNDRTFYQALDQKSRDMNDRLSTLERELGLVKKAARELERKFGAFQDDTITRLSEIEKVELKKTINSTRKALSRHTGGHYIPFSISKADRATRNELAHSLNLKPCLYLVDNDSTLELPFSAYFGVSTVEAKTLLDYDKENAFSVDHILSNHANLWKAHAPNSFIKPFDAWLERVSALAATQPGSADVEVIESLRVFSKEVLEKARLDLDNATGEQDLLENLVADWKKRGIWEDLVEAWKLPYSTQDEPEKK